MGKKILIAEDSSVIQNLTRKILSIQNYDITSVKNGAQVLKKLSEEKYDLLLLDINMPVMDGEECAHAIRNNQESHINQLPIIAITGNARNYSREDFDRMGINEVLTKPLNFDEVVTTVNKFVA
jgi:hypothetical protein